MDDLKWSLVGKKRRLLMRDKIDEYKEGSQFIDKYIDFIIRDLCERTGIPEDFVRQVWNTKKRGD